ncbi:MAG: transposase, partial [Thermoplasmata archaeon]
MWGLALVNRTSTLYLRQSTEGTCSWTERLACLESFAETCYRLGVKMEACEFGPDHVHLFVSGCRKYFVPYMAQMFKGASSRKIRLELWDNVRGKLWGDSFW